MKEITITYKITETDSWRSKEGINIKSNLAEDKLIDCQLAESLVTELKEKAHLLDADKLLLSFAEAQKRGIQDNLEALNDLELAAKNHSDSIHQKLMETEEDLEQKYDELAEKFQTVTAKFDKNLTATTEKLTQQIENVKTIEKSLASINTYSFEAVIKTFNDLLKIINKDPELVKLVFKHKFN